MRTFDWTKVNKWTGEMIQAYFAEQMALLMKRQTEALEGLERLTCIQLEGALEKREVAELALELMTNKDAVIMAFQGCSRVPLTHLRDRLCARGFRAFTSRLKEAIPLTDYLVLEAAGNGWRVWRADDYETARRRPVEEKGA